MKKVTIIFAAVALMFAIASCGTKTTEEAVVVDSIEAVEAPKADTAIVAEEARIDSSVNSEAIQ